MAYSDELAERVRHTLSSMAASVDERSMFGGLAFMVAGHMTVGVLGDDLMVRIGREAYEDALAQPGARPMDFTGKPMTTMVYVAGPTLDDTSLNDWVRRGLTFTSSLPPK